MRIASFLKEKKPPPPRSKKEPGLVLKERVSVAGVISVIETITGIDDLLLKMPELDEDQTHARRLMFWALNRWAMLQMPALGEMYLVPATTVQTAINRFTDCTKAGKKLNPDWHEQKQEITATLVILARLEWAEKNK